MKKILVVIIISIISLVAIAQSLNEMQNSYNCKRGMELLFAETPDESGALDCFKKEITEHPKNGYAWYCMGLIYDNNDKKGDALECLNKAVDLLKKDKTWSAFSYRARASVLQDLGHDEQALSDLNSAFKIDPTDNTTLKDRALFYFNKGKYNMAEADYDLMIKNEPGNSNGYLNKALMRMLKKDYHTADNLCTYSIKLDPTNARAYTLRTNLYIDMNNIDGASDDAISALNIDPREGMNAIYQFDSTNMSVILAKLRIQQIKDKNNYVWSFAQALLLEGNAQFNKAIEAYKNANNIYASDVFISRIARCYSQLGMYQDALGYIHQAMLMDSTNTAYIMEEGDILYNLGLPRDAISSLTTYIEKEPDDYMGYYRRGFIKDCMGDIDGAIEDYTTCLVLQPDYNYALVERGECYKLKGNKAAAEADWKTDIEVDTVFDYCCAHYAYEGLGQFDKAKEVMDSILALSPDKGNYYDAACLYSRMGEFGKALEFLRTSLEKGYRCFYHIAHDRDLDGIRNRPDFKAIIDQYKSKVNRDNNENADSSASEIDQNANSALSERISEIPFTRETGGLCKVKCNINGLPLNFWIDTGASDVSLSIVEATFMIKNGFITKDDVVGNAYFLDANGNVNEGTILNLRSVKFGDSELKNVKASVVSNLRAPLLLGQSVLARLGSVEFDNTRHIIRIKYYK